MIFDLISFVAANESRDKLMQMKNDLRRNLTKTYSKKQINASYSSLWNLLFILFFYSILFFFVRLFYREKTTILSKIQRFKTLYFETILQRLLASELDLLINIERKEKKTSKNLIEVRDIDRHK